VDLDHIYATTQEVSEYPHLVPGRVNPSDYYGLISSFDVRRETIRTMDEMLGRAPRPLMIAGWLGELGTGVKQRRLKRGPRGWSRWVQWWKDFRCWLSGMEIGIDGV
jgi:hypothetical protein